MYAAHESAQGFYLYTGGRVPKERRGHQSDNPIVRVVVDPTIKKIEDKAFKDCCNLESIELPKGLRMIGKGAFMFCTRLSSIRLPDGLREIGEGAFCECRSLARVALPEGLELIGKRAFKACNNITFADFPTGLQIGEDAFLCCRALKSSPGFYVYSGGEVPKERKGGNVRIGSKSSFRKADNPIVCVIVDHNVRNIPLFTFSNCCDLEYVFFPQGLQKIGKFAFEGCSKLSSIQLPDKLCDIGVGVFCRCNALSSIHLPDGLQVIPERAFEDCKKLSSVHLPEQLQIIEHRAFAWCKALKSIYLPSGLRVIEEEAFASCTQLLVVAIPPEVSVVEDTAFSGCICLDTSTNKLKTRFDDLPLHQACYMADEEEIRRTLTNESANKTDMCNLTPLHILATNPNTTKIMIQIVADAFPDAVARNDNFLGMPPLHFASTNVGKHVGDFITYLTRIVTSQGKLGCTVINSDDRTPTSYSIVCSSKKTIQRHLFKCQPCEKALFGNVVSHKNNVKELQQWYVGHITSLSAGDLNSADEKHGWVEFVKDIDEPEINRKICMFIRDADVKLVRKLAEATDQENRMAIDTTNLDIKSAFAKRLLLFGRYKIVNKNPIHKSKTCTVDFAVDASKGDNDNAKNVAIKTMTDKRQFCRELKHRLKDTNIESGRDICIDMNRFDEDHVVPLLRYHQDDQTRRCIVMPRGERNLTDIIHNERIAGHNMNAIIFFAVDVAEALKHLHQRMVVHLDFKPRNIVRIHGDYKLIDFDASAQIGNPLTKKCSSGFIPPEVAKVRFRPKESLEELEQKSKRIVSEMDDLCSRRDFKGIQAKQTEKDSLETKIQQLRESPNRQEIIPANTKMDIWSYGVVMYQMLTGESLFNCDLDDNLKNEEEKRKLIGWKDFGRTDLENVSFENHEYTESAKDLLRQCLKTNPNDRPASMNDVLRLPFLNRKCVSVQFQNTQLQHLAEGQKKLNAKMNQIGKKNNKVVRSIFELKEDIRKSIGELKGDLQKSIRMSRRILGDTVAPKYFCIVPNDITIEDMFNINITVSRKATLYFLCPVTFSVPKDTEGKPRGYDLLLRRDWIRKLGPALCVSLKVLKLAVAVGRLAGVPLLPDLDNVRSETNVVRVIADNIVKYSREDEDQNHLAPDNDLKRVSDVMEGFATLSDHSSDMEAAHLPKELRKLVQKSYEEVQKIADNLGDSRFLETGLSKVYCEKDGSQEYVLDDARIKAVFEAEGRVSLEFIPEELKKRNLDFHAVLVEGRLGKKKKTALFKKDEWKERYFVLLKNGILTCYDSVEERIRDVLGVKGKIVSSKVKEIVDTKKNDLIVMKFSDDTENKHFKTFGNAKEWSSRSNGLMIKKRVLKFKPRETNNKKLRSSSPKK